MPPAGSADAPSPGFEPLVSIVTPSFQQARFLRETIESVAAQGRSDIEHIVIDGGSTDGSVEILASYGDRLRWVSEPDQGQADALNKGFRMARGRILAWINSDDILLPGAVDAAVEAFQSDPHLGLVHGHGYSIDSVGNHIQAFSYIEPFNLQRLLYFGDTVLQQSAFFSREALDAVGGLDAGLRWTLDWDLFIRIGMRFPVRTLPVEMGAIRIHPDAKTSTGGFQRLAEIERMLARHTFGQRTPAYDGARLETWDLLLTRRFGQTPLVGRAWRNLHDFLARRIFPRMEECCGWLHDGWATHRVELLLPRLGGGRLTLDGEQPSGGGELRLLLDGQPAWADTPAPGPFQTTVEIPGAGDTPVRLQIEAATARFHRSRLHGGRQELCWRLHSVRYEAERGCVELPPPRLLISPDVPGSQRPA